jgi:hypothetical protein
LKRETSMGIALHRTPLIFLPRLSVKRAWADVSVP